MVQKKLTALLLALALTVVFAACAGGNDDDNGGGIFNPMSGGAGRWARASGTFTGTYTLVGNALTLNGGTVSKNLMCGGVQAGDIWGPTVTTLAADTLIMDGNNDRIWKCVGTCTGIVGTWRTRPKDRPWETDTMTFKADLSVKGVVTGLNCTEGWVEYDCATSRYYLNVWVYDPQNKITSVKLSGPKTLMGATIDLGDYGSYFELSEYIQPLVTPHTAETFKVTILEGTTTIIVKDRQIFYDDCATCVAPQAYENLSGDTATLKWDAVPGNSQFVDYDVEFDGPDSGETVLYKRTTTSTIFPDDDFTPANWYQWYITTEYTTGETDRYCGQFHVN